MPGFTYVGKLKNSFICDKRLSSNDVRVYLSLKKWESWQKPVTVETMAKEIGMTRKLFSKSIKNLESLKYIKVIKNSNWECYKYKVLNKAHVSESPTDVSKSPTIDGSKSPILIKTICNTKEINKEKSNGDLPEWLDKEAWKSWLAYNKEKKKKLPPSTIKYQIKRLENLGIENQVAVIEQAIERSYASFFPINKTKEPDRNLGRQYGQ